MIKFAFCKTKQRADGLKEQEQKLRVQLVSFHGHPESGDSNLVLAQGRDLSPVSEFLC